MTDKMYADEDVYGVCGPNWRIPLRASGDFVAELEFVNCATQDSNLEPAD